MNIDFSFRYNIIYINSSGCIDDIKTERIYNKLLIQSKDYSHVWINVWKFAYMLRSKNGKKTSLYWASFKFLIQIHWHDRGRCTMMPYPQPRTSLPRPSPSHIPHVLHTNPLFPLPPHNISLSSPPSDVRGVLRDAHKFLFAVSQKWGP